MLKTTSTDGINHILANDSTVDLHGSVALRLVFASVFLSGVQFFGVDTNWIATRNLVVWWLACNVEWCRTYTRAIQFQHILFSSHRNFRYPVGLRFLSFFYSVGCASCALGRTNVRDVEIKYDSKLSVVESIPYRHIIQFHWYLETFLVQVIVVDSIILLLLNFS